uniref:Uncharacterized protein n=1 Tax=Rhizophora mucronata TaxID=61149 RepID=A0A2P2QKW5_RHIMU
MSRSTLFIWWMAFSVSFIFWVSHHIMVSNHQNKYEYSKKIGKKSEVLIIKHLFAVERLDLDHDTTLLSLTLL